MLLFEKLESLGYEKKKAIGIFKKTKRDGKIN